MTIDSVARWSWGRTLVVVLRLVRLGLVLPVVVLIDLYALRFAGATLSWVQPFALVRLLLAAGVTLRALPVVTVLVLPPSRQAIFRRIVKVLSLAVLAGTFVALWQVFSAPRLAVPHVGFPANTPLDRVLQSLNNAASTFDTLAVDLKPSP